MSDHPQRVGRLISVFVLSLTLLSALAEEPNYKVSELPAPEGTNRIGSAFLLDNGTVTAHWIGKEKSSVVLYRDGRQVEALPEPPVDMPLSRVTDTAEGRVLGVSTTQHPLIWEQGEKGWTVKVLKNLSAHRAIFGEDGSVWSEGDTDIVDEQGKLWLRWVGLYPSGDGPNVQKLLFAGEDKKMLVSRWYADGLGWSTGYRSYLVEGGKATPITDELGRDFQVMASNSNGDLIGLFVDWKGAGYGCSVDWEEGYGNFGVWSKGSFKPLRNPAGAGRLIYGRSLSSNGIGLAVRPGGWFYILRDGGSAKVVPDKPENINCMSINNHGQILAVDGYLSDGKLRILNPIKGATSTSPTDR